ncbi:reverse transcriptase domain-containing protein, partial [Tanacetum coccineum]
PAGGLKRTPPRSITTWDDLVSKFINEFFPPSRTTNLQNEISNRYKDLLRACPHHGFSELHQLKTFYNALNPSDQDSLNSAAGGNLLEKSTQDVLTIIENKSKVCNSRNKSVVSQVKSSDGNSSSSDIAKLTHTVNQQTSAVTTAMTAILKQFQATPPPASVKAVKEICVTCGGPHPYYQCLAADGNTFPEYQDNIHGYVAAAAGNYNQGNAGYRPLDPDHGEYTIKVPPPQVQKAKPPSQRNFVIYQRDPRYPHIPYPSRMNQEKQKEKDDVPIHKFWQMFKQLHINISLADALILIPKYQKMLKSLLSNKEKLIELANTSLNENFSAVILKKLPEKLGDPGKFLIPCGFSELKCKALADLGASINLMPLSVWKELGLPELISTQMTLELANRDICTPKGIARDVFIPVGKFTFPADFVIVDYESDPRVPLILGRPFLQTARALIDVHGEEMILRDGNERLILNMRNDTSSYSNEPHQESINMIDVYNVSHEEIHEDLFATNHRSGNPTSSLTFHTNLTSTEVNDDIFDPEEDIIENLLNLDKTKDLPPYHDNQSSGNPTPISKPKTKSSSSSPTLISLEERNSNPSSILPPFHNSLSSSTTSSSPSLHISETGNYSLEEFANELAHITFPPGNNDLPFDAKSDLLELEYLLNHDPIKDMDSILEDSVDENSLDDNLDDTISEEFANELAPSESFPPGNNDMTPKDVIKEVKCLLTQSPLANYSLDNGLINTILEMFTDEHALDYSSPPLWDDYDDNIFDHETINDDTYDDPFDFKEEKIKDSKILIDKLDLPKSNNVLPFPECDSVFYEDFSKVDSLSSTNNEDKVFNPGILIHENLFEVANFATPDKNVKKTTNASLILEDFNPPLYELLFHKEVLGLGALLLFSSRNEEKVYNPRILTSKRVHTSLLIGH